MSLNVSGDQENSLKTQNTEIMIIVIDVKVAVVTEEAQLLLLVGVTPRSTAHLLQGQE